MVGFEGVLRTDPFIHLGFRGFWLTSAIRQLFELQVCNAFFALAEGCNERHGQINHKSVISNIQDPEARGAMIFAWWMACLSDSYGSAYYRRQPQIDDNDYDVDFYIVDPVAVDPDGQTKPGPREQLEVRPVFAFFPFKFCFISSHANLFLLRSSWYALPRYYFCNAM